MTAEERGFLKTIGALATVADTAAIEHKQDKFLSTLDNKIKAYTGGFGVGYTGWNQVLWRPFDGERNLGGMGPINNYFLDYESLRLRAWQLILESEIVQIGIQRYAMWLIGGGLRLSSEPDTDVLKMCGITLDDPQEFSKQIEGLWNLWSNNENSDKAQMETLHAKIYQAEINALVAGDCLFIINIDDDGMPQVEIKDGCHVRTPLLGAFMNGIETVNPDTGNRVRHGIEIDKDGQHVAFFVRRGKSDNSTVVDWLNYERVEAKDKTTGYVRAFMYYGLRYRLDDVRGIPLISVCMETTKQLERYKEATVSGAVERAKVAIVLEHELGALGTNPFENQLLKATGGPFSDLPKSIEGRDISNTVAATTDKQAINTTPGTSMKVIDSKQEIHFNEFFDTNMTIIFAAIGIPKEIALMLFGSNYSASRASIKDWEHTLKVKREKNVKPGYKHVYNMFLITHLFHFPIKAKGYFEAIFTKSYDPVKNRYIRWAYENAEWVGDNPPNIDELKEVTAARLKAGAGSAHLPFDTFEKIIRDLGITGDVRHIFDEYQNDMLYADDIGIEKVENKSQIIEDFDDPDEDKKGKPGKKGDDKKKTANQKP